MTSTCGRTGYLATVIDCCSRKLAGWALGDHMRTDLVETALGAALAEAFVATIKRETLAGAATYSDEAACRDNTRRRHSCLRHQAPNTYEHQLTATLPEAAYQTHRVQDPGQGPASGEWVPYKPAVRPFGRWRSD